MKEPSIEELTAEAMQLLPMGLEELYMILGAQLLVSAKPTRCQKGQGSQRALRYLTGDADAGGLERRPGIHLQ